MNRPLFTLFAILTFSLFAQPTLAGNGCSVRDIAGKWMFATGIGRQALGEPFPPGKDITAIGTMNIGRDGTLEGTFDITVQDFAHIPDLYYSGSVVVYPDCTGTINFVTSAGSARTDSIVVIDRREILAMSQDPLNLWTYQIRRISRGLGRGDRDD